VTDSSRSLWPGSFNKGLFVRALDRVVAAPHAASAPRSRAAGRCTRLVRFGVIALAHASLHALRAINPPATRPEHPQSNPLLGGFKW
jgi:hypothetical protein